MGGVGGHAVVVHHALGIAVVGGNEGHAAHGAGGFHHLAHALVHSLHSDAGGLIDAGVAHHVAVGEVEDNDVIRAALNPLDGLRGHLTGAHVGLHVVGGHLGRGDEGPVLPGEDRLLPAVEEEGHMGVLLGLGDAQLGEAQPGDILAKDVGELPVGEGHLHAGHGGVVLGGAYIGDGKEAPFALHVGEVGVDEAAGDLPGPVGAEVHKDDGVARVDRRVFHADHRLHELVGDARIVGLLDGVHRVGIEGPLAAGDGVVGPLHAVPALIPVHGVEASHDGGDPPHAQLSALGGKLRHKVPAGGGGHVTPVQEAVDEDPAQALALGHLQDGKDVGDVAVDAAVGQQPHHMEGGAVLSAVVHGLQIGGVFEEVAVGDGLGDAGQVLEDHAARADVGVAHLAVAHLAVGQAHVQA